MVIHENSEMSMEVGVLRKQLLEQKSYVIVKNHVRELINTIENPSSVKKNKEKSPLRTEYIEKKKRKSDNKKTEQLATHSADSEVKNCDTEIDKNDLQELRSVYMKCKQVMRKIESKYGHLLDLESEAGPSSSKKRHIYTDENSEDECDCKINKKIIFDDDGNQSTVETVSEKHICVKKGKNAHQEVTTSNQNIAIEYTENEIALPDNLQELGILLQDPNIERSLRYKIIDKMRIIKQDYVNNIRFNKPALIEKLKVNPDEVLAFKGTNLSSISGYL